MTCGMKNQRKKVARLFCWAAISGVGAPVVSTLAICGAKASAITVTTPRPTSATPRIPEARRSVSSWSPASRWETKVGTSTAESAPAACSSNRTFDTEIVAWHVLPR